MQISQSLESIVFGLNEENIEASVQSTNNLFVDIFPYTFNLLVSKFIYSAFASQTKNEDLVLKYLLALNTKEEETTKTATNLIQIFCRYLLGIETQESYFLLQQLIEQGLLEPNLVKNLNTLYFSQFKTKEEIKKLERTWPKPQFFDEFFSTLEELSKEDWKLHIQYLKEGINPLEIVKILRNDDLEKLQEISTQNNFDFNQKIKPSLYERYSFINKENVSLIDYCAFFGSIQCFKYLLLNGANVKNTLKYAIAGGNLEIIHLCEQNNSLFKEVFETAIEFHRNDIFYYFYDKKIIENNDIKKLGIKCIKYNNYEIFSYLEKEGMKINDEIINQISENGNTFLINDFIQKNQIPYNIIVYACISGNIEIVKILLEQKDIDIDAKDI